MLQTYTPRLLPHFIGTQLVDGNNYLLNRFQQQGEGLVVRNIVADINQCQHRPVFVFDAPDGNARRRKLFPEYKVKLAAEMVARESLWPQLKLFKSIMLYTTCVTVEVPGWEADDVIATLAVTTSGQKRIITTDRDLSQLAVLPTVEVTAAYLDVEPKHIRLYKTYVGDSSDKIKGVPMFGPLAWKHLNKEVASKFDFHNYGPKELCMKPSHYAWCLEHVDLLRIYYETVRLLPVPMSEISPCIRVGSDDRNAVNTRLREFML